MKRALICFIKYPQAGHVKTRLGAELGHQQAAELYRSMAERIISELYPLQAHYALIIQYDPNHARTDYQSWLDDRFQFAAQRGSHLGERLTEATETGFEEGYNQVVVIGSDCIGMDETFMNTVFDQLAKVDVVLGPSSDGGYYLIGMNRPLPELFEHIPWSSSSVLDETLSQIEKNGLCHNLLEEKMDIDTLDDLTRFRAQLPPEHYIARKIDALVLEQMDS